VAHLDGAHLEGANLRGAYTAPSQQPGMGPVLHQPEPEQRLTVPEAADALGVTPEAVRTRIQRGTLRSVRERGREFVLFGEWCSFRVWAPNAQEISLAGSFNDWADEQIWLEKEDQGYWSADVRRIRRDDTYKYVINHGGGSTGALTRTRGR
jgi:hypothetical protein